MTKKKSINVQKGGKQQKRIEKKKQISVILMSQSTMLLFSLALGNTLKEKITIQGNKMNS